MISLATLMSIIKCLHTECTQGSGPTAYASQTHNEIAETKKSVNHSQNTIKPDTLNGYVYTNLPDQVANVYNRRSGIPWIIPIVLHFQ